MVVLLKWNKMTNPDDRCFGTYFHFHPPPVEASIKSWSKLRTTPREHNLVWRRDLQLIYIWGKWGYMLRWPFDDQLLLWYCVLGNQVSFNEKIHPEVMLVWLLGYIFIVTVRKLNSIHLLLVFSDYIVWSIWGCTSYRTTTLHIIILFLCCAKLKLASLWWDLVLNKESNSCRYQGYSGLYTGGLGMTI